MHYSGGAGSLIGSSNSSMLSASELQDSQPLGIGLTLVDGRFRVACAAAAGPGHL
jgi:hypothetical protein